MLEVLLDVEANMPLPSPRSRAFPTLPRIGDFIEYYCQGTEPGQYARGRVVGVTFDVRNKVIVHLDYRR